MILSFSDPRFEARIKAGIKIHTIREDKHNRWKPGMKIHFWMHNPRNVKKNPYQFGEGEVSTVIYIRLTDESVFTRFGGNPWPLNFAKNDGFDSIEEMKAYFKLPFEGRIIYWTNCKWF